MRAAPPPTAAVAVDSDSDSDPDTGFELVATSLAPQYDVEPQRGNTSAQIHIEALVRGGSGEVNLNSRFTVHADQVAAFNRGLDQMFKRLLDRFGA